MSQYAYFCYHRKDDNVFETCINSLRLSNENAKIVVCTDGVPKELEERMSDEYGVNWLMVPPEKMTKRRATCKIEVLCDLANKLNSEDVILVSDVDVYFKSDPFVPFGDYPDMDLGLTTRDYKHLFPINGGIFYVRVNDKMKEWLKWHVQEVYNPRWELYVKLRRRYNHERFGLDWSVGQDFLIANWLHREQIRRDRDINITDVGHRYNFCPPTDLLGQKAFDSARQALKAPSIVTIHLKSDLKRMIYEPGFPNAKTNNPKGTLAWM